MDIQKKPVMSICLLIISMCVCMTVFSYISAVQGFSFALKIKAESDSAQILEILDKTYPGDWHADKCCLYKGEKKINGAFDDVDFFGKLCGNNITIFRGSMRVATTFVGKDEIRLVGTQASDEIIHEVLVNGNNFSGMANVLGKEYLCSYRPLRDKNGSIIGMLFVGIPPSTIDLIRVSFLRNMIIVMTILISITSIMTWFIIKKLSQQKSEGGRTNAT